MLFHRFLREATTGFSDCGEPTAFSYIGGYIYYTCSN